MPPRHVHRQVSHLRQGLVERARAVFAERSSSLALPDATTLHRLAALAARHRYASFQSFPRAIPAIDYNTASSRQLANLSTRASAWLAGLRDASFSSSSSSSSSYISFSSSPAPRSSHSALPTSFFC